MAHEDARESAQLYRIAQMWRRDCTGVLLNRDVQRSVGPHSESLLKMARGLGILAINSSDSKLSKRYIRRPRTGTSLVPVSSSHSPETVIKVTRKNKETTYPVGVLVLEQDAKDRTPAMHLSSSDVPDLSFISFYTEQEDLTPFDRAAVMVHELEHARRFHLGMSRGAPDDPGEANVAVVEAPAYDMQFRLLDACHAGRLSEIVEYNLDKYDLSQPRHLTGDERMEQFMDSSPVVAEAVITRLVNKLCGYDPAEDLSPPEDLTNIYKYLYGEGNAS